MSGSVLIWTTYIAEFVDTVEVTLFVRSMRGSNAQTTMLCPFYCDVVPTATEHNIVIKALAPSNPLLNKEICYISQSNM